MVGDWLHTAFRALVGERRTTRRAVVPAALASLGAAALPVAAAAGPRVRSGPRNLPTRLLEGKPLADAGPGAARKTKLGVREIYSSEDCMVTTAEYPEGVICGVPCPETKQAIGGGVLDLTANAWFIFDTPWEDTDYAWGAALVPLDDADYGALPFVVCMNR